VAFADIGSIRIHYEFTGSAPHPVLVLSNSLGATLAMWEPQLDALSAHFRLLRYDTRGHGQSAAPTGPYTIADLAGDVLGLLDHLDIPQPSFCGISMGGQIGQWLAIHASNRIARVVLASTAAKIGTIDGWNNRVASVLEHGLEPLIPGTIERWLTAPFNAAHPEVGANIRSMLQGADRRGYAACCEAIRDADFRAEISRIAIPTLVISAAEDPATPPAD